jgi:phytoene desaturase
MAQVVVVGGGRGGLAAAVGLQADGLRVTLVEAREALGGRAGQIRERGFTFDTGPTIVTAPDLLTRLWQHAGRSIADDLELIPLRPFYEIRFRDGSRFRYADRSPCTEAGGADVATDATSPRAALEREIMALSPGDLAGYRAFMAATERIYRRAFAQLAGRPFHELRQFVAVVPELLKLGAHRSVYDLAARYFRDERLRVAFSFHPLFIGGNPFRASAIYSIIPFLEQRGGVWYVRGGTYALVCALERLFRALGGEVRTGQPVREIVVRDGWPASASRAARRCRPRSWSATPTSRRRWRGWYRPSIVGAIGCAGARRTATRCRASCSISGWTASIQRSRITPC